MADGGDLACAERRLGGPEGAVRFSREVAGAICARLASGESLRGICAEAGMPHRSSVVSWMRKMPRFRGQVEAARAASGWRSTVGGRRSTWCEVTAQLVFERMLRGETLTSICDDPAMPGYVTLWKWRRQHPEFDEALQLARESQAERLADKGMQIADAVTPETAYAVRVRLGQLRWTAQSWMPGRYGRLKPIDPPKPPEPPVELVVKRFEIEVRDDGATRVVALTPDFETGRLVAVEPRGPWGPPPETEGRWARREAWNRTPDLEVPPGEDEAEITPRRR